MYFRSIEKSALLHFLVKMTFADGYAVNSERDIVHGVIGALDMDEDDVSEAQDMSDARAERILASLGATEKKFVSAALGTMIQIDGEADYAETGLYSQLCVRCGLPYMGPRQAGNTFFGMLDV